MPDSSRQRGHSGEPRLIVIQKVQKNLWSFEIMNANGECVDYSMAASLGSVYRMAKRSWKWAEKKGGIR